MPDTHDAAALNRRLAELLGWRSHYVTEEEDAAEGNPWPLAGTWTIIAPQGWGCGGDYCDTEDEAWQSALSVPNFCTNANTAIRALEAVRRDKRWGKSFVGVEIYASQHRDGAWGVAVDEPFAEGRADTIPAAVTLACIAALERLGEEER